GTEGEAARTRITLHEGEALGVRRRRWTLGGDDGDPLVPEARALLGLLASALGPLPAAGPVRDLVDALAALRITEPGTSEETGAPVALSIDGVRRLLLDPAAQLAEAQAPPLASALARLTGSAPPSPATPSP